MTMTSTTTTAKFSYKIEAKPDGGFVAVPTEPGMEPIEGSSREEVEQKIQAKVAEMIGAQLSSSFKFGGVNVTVNRKVNFSVRNASGSLITGSRMSNTLQDIPANGEAAPIVPTGGGSAIRIFAWAVGLAVLIYFIFLRH